MTKKIREPAVAGLFYPAEADSLGDAVRLHLEDGRRRASGAAPKALIAPHAGYVYSGPIAGSGFALLEPARDTIRRVVLLGPAHFVPFRGLALSGADAFATPLGEVSVDHRGEEWVSELPQVQTFEAAHEREHSLEVELPFLQETLDSFEVIALVVGDATIEEVGQVIDRLWGGAETLIVVSSDLSHYFDYETARQLDAKTASAIEGLRPGDLASDSACGVIAVRGLLDAARRHGLSARTVDLRNSGDTAGSKDEVVGYGAFAFN